MNIEKLESFIKKNIRLLVGLVIVIALVLIAYFVFFAKPEDANATINNNVTICHATGSNNNPYNKQTVNWTAVDGNGNGDHNRSGHQNGEDIIPPGFWDLNGRNWNTQGQAIWNNDCNVPEKPTPTPTEEPTPTPTVEPTVTPTPTPEDPCEPNLSKEAILLDIIIDPCDEEPTPTPTPTDKPVTYPSVVSSEPSAPGVCVDNSITKPANIYVTTTGNSGELVVQWALPLNASEVHIEYGLTTSAEHSLLNTPNDGNEVIRNLTSGQHYWFRVAGVNGCAVGPWSDWYDPLVP